jgi:4-diphosphocytidyl-2-C-methyl-D-erythritol kinase
MNPAPSRPGGVTVRVPGKVNLALAAGGPGPDGYHELATVFHAVALFDEVTAVASASGAGIGLHVVGDAGGEVPRDARNLAWRAAAAVADALDVAPDVELRITKGIPVAGGMAGGSADAAAALVACAALWDVEGVLGRSELERLGRALGADVPFALHGGTALGTGRGDRITPVLMRGGLRWVFAVATRGLSTPEVFARLDHLRADRVLPEPRVADEVLEALAAGDPARIGAAMSNDLQAAALDLRPELAEVLAAGTGAGALSAVVSGSGPTCAFLVADDAASESVAGACARLPMVQSVHRASGPAHGARLLD